MRRRGTDAEGGSDEAAGASAAFSATSFTFVNQADDPVSLSHRKINDKEQRHVIRSHVMQRVRQQELSQGKKRSTDRKTAKKPSLEKQQSSASKSTSSCKSELDDPLSVLIKPEPTEPNEALDAAHSSSTSSRASSADQSPTEAHLYQSLCLTPAVELFDPFGTLPGNDVPHRTIERLLVHCFDVLLPQTFKVEFRNTSERLARQGMVLQSKASNPAVFLGFMGTVAAHRAIVNPKYRKPKTSAAGDPNLEKLITDPEYAVVKQQAILAVRKKIENFKPQDHDLIDACFGLISTATVAGNFEEAKTHLKGTAALLHLVGAPEHSTVWVPITNNKVALGLFTKPILGIPWTREPIPNDMFERMSTLSITDMSRSCQGFKKLNGLTRQLQSLILACRDLWNLVGMNAMRPAGLQRTEMAIISRKGTELEYDLLSYAYRDGLFPRDKRNEPVLPPLEAVVRVAVLGLLSIFPHSVSPSTGLGMAITNHQKKALDTWLRSTSQSGDHDELMALIWILFIFTQLAQGQPEEAFFMDHLEYYMRKSWLRSWEEVEATMYEFIYVPELQAKSWKLLFEEIVRQRRSASAIAGGPEQFW